MIHLEMDGKHSYYTTLAALYSHHTQDEIGVSLGYLQNTYHLKSRGIYENKKVTLRYGILKKKAE